MLMNNLDPEVAERPDQLMVYGGSGKAARNWECFWTLVAALGALEDDETLLVQSGKPLGVFRTHPRAPRVLLADSLLVPAWAAWEHFWGPGSQGAYYVRADECRLVDLHRDPGHLTGDLRTLRPRLPAGISGGAGAAAWCLRPGWEAWAARSRW